MPFNPLDYLFYKPEVAKPIGPPIRRPLSQEEFAEQNPGKIGKTQKLAQRGSLARV